MDNKEIEFFNRDDDGKLLPVKTEIDTRNKLILDQIDLYQDKLKIEKKEKNKLIYQNIINTLEESYKESGEIMEIEFIPIMDYEFDIFKDSEDRLALVIDKKLLKPRIKFEDAKVMKNKRLKTAIVDMINKVSMPELKENEERIKKVMAQLMKIEG